MNRRPAIVLPGALLVFAALSLAGAARFGLNYEESVAYAPCRLDVAAAIDARQEPASIRYTDHRENEPPGSPGSAGGARLVRSETLPRLALEAPFGWIPLLNQIYMTNHLALLGAVIARVVDPALGPRVLHAIFGLVSLLLLYDVGRAWLSERARLFAVALASVSATFTFMFTWARFDESLPSVASLASLAFVLRYQRDGRARWIALAALAAGLGISAKLTTLWPLFAMMLAAAIARGPSLPSARALRHIAAALPLALLGFVPLIVNGFLHPESPTGSEVARRLALIPQIVTTTALPRAFMSLALYLGAWGSMLRGLILGVEGPTIDLAGRLLLAPGCGLVLATLVFLAIRAFRAGPSPRRARPEMGMLIFLGALLLLVALFYNEHMDYQFVLTVPLFWLGPGAMLDALATSLEARGAGARRAASLVVIPFLAAGLIEQVRLQSAIDHARNPMVDLHAQRAAAAFLMDRGITRPVDTTFHATAVYEQLSRGEIRPLHVFELFRDRNLSRARLSRAWAHILAVMEREPMYVLLPLGENPVESRHFDEPAIREALLEEAARGHGGAELVTSFTNRAGDPLIELYKVRPLEGKPRDQRLGVEPPDQGRAKARSSADGLDVATADDIPASERTFALLAELRPGKQAGPFVITSISEPCDDGSIHILATRGEQRVLYELRSFAPKPSPPASAGPYGIYYREPRGRGAPTIDEVMQGAQSIAAHLERLSPSSPLPEGLRPPSPPPI